MRKRFYIFITVTALAAISLSGCKSKEKTDLSGIHSAAETMTPETMADSTSEAAKETEKETTKADETKKEEETEETKKGGSTSSALSVRSKIATEKTGKVSIEYPILSNLRDTKTEEAVNALIKETALRPVTDNELDSAADTVSVTCKIISLDRNKAVLSFEGSMMVNGAAYPVNLFYTANVDLNKGELIGLSDYADPYTMAGYILSEDLIIAKPSNSKEVREYLQSQDINDLWAILEASDFTSEKADGFPQAFSYENQGSIYMAVPVSHALGDYAIVRFNPDTK